MGNRFISKIIIIEFIWYFFMYLNVLCVHIQFNFYTTKTENKGFKISPYPF